MLNSFCPVNGGKLKLIPPSAYSQWSGAMLAVLSQLSWESLLNGPTSDAKGLAFGSSATDFWVCPTRTLLRTNNHSPRLTSERVYPPPVMKFRPPDCTSVIALLVIRSHPLRNHTAEKLVWAKLKEVL